MRFGSLHLPLYAALVLSGAGFAAERTSVTKVSSDSTWSIRLRQVDEKTCTVEGLMDSEVKWNLEGCVGSPDDLYFIANSGKRFWVIYTLPEYKVAPAALNPRHQVIYSPAVKYAKSRVARLYDSSGKLIRERQLQDFMPVSTFGKIQELGKHFKWLGGAVGLPGKSPHVNENNQVELETLEPKLHRLDF